MKKARPAARRFNVNLLLGLTEKKKKKEGDEGGGDSNYTIISEQLCGPAIEEGSLGHCVWYSFIQLRLSSYCPSPRTPSGRKPIYARNKASNLSALKIVQFNYKLIIQPKF